MLARAIKWHKWLQQLSLVKHTYGLLNYDYQPTYKHADVTLICSLWILPSLTRSFRCRGTRNTKKKIFILIYQSIYFSILARIQYKIWNSFIKLSKDFMLYITFFLFIGGKLVYLCCRTIIIPGYCRTVRLRRLSEIWKSRIPDAQKKEIIIEKKLYINAIFKVNFTFFLIAR